MPVGTAVGAQEKRARHSLRRSFLPSGKARSVCRAGKRSASRLQLSARRWQKGERGLWPRRFWEHVIRDERDYERQVDSLHYHPVKHGQVTRVAAWPYSSFQRDVERGVYDLDWEADDNVRSLEMDYAKGGVRFAFPPYGCLGTNRSSNRHPKALAYFCKVLSVGDGFFCPPEDSRRAIAGGLAGC